ncbi:cysteine desulfurase family protein [Nitrococcus mobilis]|uniref:cysteine desulfurase n=1 Tax=Nitrococcus mobilis Nb-231 TaxID=314278 RepID=A4BSU7_9GAMM|nr:aminotransferase class V-fold PLP-dependent enzyme [Nitrococcus mobilis]EAR21191.1 cysteine desulfurase [Nitrococcus mobilis Nb-231]
MSARQHETIYLDYAATTPVDPEVVRAMANYLSGDGVFANPASEHAPGQQAAEALAVARLRVAALVGAEPGEIVFTSGATEANNLAIAGAARWRRRHGRGQRIVTVRTEHKSVLETCTALAAEGFAVSYLDVGADGRLDPAALDAVLDDDTALVSVMHVNNETGVVQDLAALATRVKAVGALLHVDAVQSIGGEPLDVRALPVDLVSLSAHKLYGPKGVGALYIRQRPRVRLCPLLHGGGQEAGLRPGTVPVHQAVGMGVACELAAQRRASDALWLKGLHQRLRESLAALGGVVLNGREDGAAHILNVSFVGIQGETLAYELQAADLAVASGSACTAALSNRAPSHVLQAMGRPAALAHAAVRFSLGRSITGHEIDTAVERIRCRLQSLRRFSPLWRDWCRGRSLQALYETATPLTVLENSPGARKREIT